MKMTLQNALKMTALAFLLGAGFTGANAQTDSCITNLKSANTNYELREFDATIRLLQRTLVKCNLDKTDKMQAHKLLALAYLAIDNLESADREAETIMKIDPNYSPDKFKDEPKYSALFSKFQPVPVFRVGVLAGVNGASINVDNYYSITHANAAEAEKNSSYAGKSGFQLGVSMEYRAWNNLWVGVQGQFRRTNYEHTLSNVENTTINYSEKMSYADIPVSLKYYIKEGKVSPFVEAGVAFSFLTNALGTTTRDDTKDIVNRIDYRNTSMTGYFGGLGAAYKVNSFQLFVNARYTVYNQYVNKEGTRYADLVNVFKYYYIDDDFRMNNWQVSLGANYNLAYKNRKTN